MLDFQLIARFVTPAVGAHVLVWFVFISLTNKRTSIGLLTNQSLASEDP